MFEAGATLTELFLLAATTGGEVGLGERGACFGGSGALRFFKAAGSFTAGKTVLTEALLPVAVPLVLAAGEGLRSDVC